MNGTHGSKRRFCLIPVFTCSALVLLAVTAASADVLMMENFTYADGDLGTVSGSVWSRHSGSPAVQNVVSNALLIDDDSAADYNKSLASAVTSGTLYAGFDLTLAGSDPPSATTALDHYFANFATTSTTGFVSRVFAFSATGGVYKVSIQRISGTGETKTDFPTTFAADTTHRVVFAYDFASETSTLWLDPSSIASTSVTNNSGANPLPTGLNLFVVRNHNTSSGDKIIDNIIVATTFDEALGATLPGDFDSNGVVDGDDFADWQDNFPTASNASLAMGDGDGDGDVDGADFVIWQTNYDAPVLVTNPVPEPAAWMLAGLALPALACLRRRK
jgi:hypothetical protein